ncbi:MAG TPA: class I SAM-dependent methyltransferase [Chitinophagaceae bacterium]|nr:class I SAM-dependent methyltransferase [Chitinophagaceae bacterium]
MDTQDAYNSWSKTYDTDINKTRDLEAEAIRSVLNNISVGHILEIGCGTGKNTVWLKDECTQLTAVDFSKEMIEQAKQKIKDDKIVFKEADITKPWNFEKADLITCSLVLEHIESISFVFVQAAKTLISGGQFYIGELHPYKQIQGSRARFEQDGNLWQLEYFVHHISDYFHAAHEAGFICKDLQEWFDTDDKNQIPRLVSYLFSKK